MGDKITTLHPHPGKQGVRIERAKYEQVRDAMVGILKNRGSLSFTELMAALEEALRGGFDGSVSWYGTTVKLDLEARGIFKRQGKAPQMISLTEVQDAD